MTQKSNLKQKLINIPTNEKKQKIHRTVSNITSTQTDCPINLIEKLDHDLNLQFENTENKIHDAFLKNSLNAEETLYNGIKKYWKTQI